MTGWTARSSSWVLGIVAVLAVLGLPASGQETQTREDVLRSLLVEVRGLRAAIEHMAAAGPRVQLAMGRLQLQEQRLSNARRRLEELRDSIANAERESGEVRERLATMDESLQRVTEPAEREAIGTQVKMLKAFLSQKAADIQRMHEQEAELTGLAATEESRWTEISVRLDELERALSER